MAIILKQSTAVDVMLGPFVDSTDGATTEEALTLSQADLQLSKNGGAAAQKNDATSATHRYGGNYMVDLDATDTNTVGHLRLMCKETGALPVIADFMVVEEAIYDALFGASATGFDSNGRVDVGSWLGTAVTTSSTTSLPEVDAKSISDDATAADNLELMYDGTGYTDGTAPASRTQVDAIGAASGGSLNFEATSDNTSSPIKTVSSVGTPTNTYTATESENGVYHTITHATNDIDWIYGFAVGGGRTAVEITFKGYLTGSNDSMLIQAYDFVGSDWETIATLNGQAGTDNITITAPLLSKHTGTGADLGNVYIRFEANGAMTSPVLNTDQLLVAAVTIGQSIGYADGAIWVDTANGTAGTEAFVNGVADNPVDTWANALTIASSVGINRFRLAGGSSVTLTGDSTGYQIIGNGDVTVNLGSRTVTNAYFQNCIIEGTGTGSGFQAHDCHVSAGASIPAGDYYGTGFKGTSGSPVTESGTGEYVLHNCFSQVSGANTPYFNFAGAGGTVGVNVRGWCGGGDWTFDSNCSASIEVDEGGGHTITTGGASIEVRGIMRALTVTMSSTETVQFVGITGPITLSGTTTGTVNLYGVSSSLSDSTSAATVTDNTTSTTNILTTQMTEAYAADGAAPTVAQSLMLIQQMLGDFAISGTTLTVKKVDGATTAATFTLNDATNPTSLTRAT